MLNNTNEISVNIVVEEVQMLVTEIPDEVGIRIVLKCRDCLTVYYIDEYSSEIAKDIEDSFHANVLPSKRDVTCPKCNSQSVENNLKTVIK